jgi:hypothetical protein
MTSADNGLEIATKNTPKQIFLEEMDAVVPRPARRD